MTVKKIDLMVANHGTIYLLTPCSPAGQSWIDEKVNPDRMMFGPSVVVEHRYIADIVVGARDDGLTVSG